MNRLSCLFAVSLTAVLARAGDWPMWRADAGRTATVAAALPEKMRVLWSRELPPLKPAYRDTRLQFDRGYEPIVLGQRLLVGSSREDCVIAFDTNTGAELWRVNADGPVRFAPVAGEGRVIFGSDDGVVRCVSAETGWLFWEKRAVPNDRQILGNERMISVWPVRGGPVLRDGRVYFAAGVWPLEGVFVFCLDAATGRTIWVNDRTGYLYGVHPHNTEALGGIAPQGYLLIDGSDLVVPSSSAYPARFDLATGALKEFALPSAGRLPGGWFASTPEEKEAQKLKRRGVIFDSAVNAKRHEDKPWEKGDAGVRRSFRAGEREWSFDETFAGVSGKIHSVIAADEKCFVVTEEGTLYALGTGSGEAKTWKREAVKPVTNDEFAEKVLNASGIERGYAVVLGARSPAFLETLATRSRLRILAFDEAARSRLVATQLYGDRIALSSRATGLPPYFASLVATTLEKEELLATGGIEPLFARLRPYGGQLVGPASLLDLAKSANLPKATLKLHTNGLAVITREGPLDGSTNYEGGWIESDDALVRAPLGVLWFGDMVSNFKRSPQPKFIDGVMVTTDKDWLNASTRKGKVDYRLLPPVFSDVYTGRVLDDYEAADLRRRFANTDTETIQPGQYRPPQQKNDWAPEAPKAGLRTNPLTGESEPRVFPKAYGCDGGFDYGSIYTMRSGTAAFYDKKLDSGTIHISGPRSGCTNSIVPANGILNVPYYYEGCTCSYPLPMGLALVSLPPTFEQWTAWGNVPAAALAGKIERVGVNFGAPGDRKTEDGTLWLDWPSVGGPSPEVIVRTHGDSPEVFYHHSVWMEGGEGWPWVAASGLRRLRNVTIGGLKPGTYTVRLVFAEPDNDVNRTFDVRVQDRVVAESLDVFAEAKGGMRALTKTVQKVAVGDGTLNVALTPRKGETILSGIEIIRDGLPMAPLPTARVPGRL